MKDKFIFSILSFACFYLLSSCAESSDIAQIDSTSPYYVDDADHLYFKNMRAYYYENTKGPSEGIDYYNLRKQSKAKDRPILQPTITDFWIKDEAYLTVGKNDFADGYADPLTIIAVQNNDTSIITLANQRPQAQTNFHLNIDKKLSQDAQLFVYNAEDQPVPILEDKGDRMAFGTIIKDYLKLVQKN